MSTQMNQATQERLAEMINTGNLDALDEVFAPDVVDHDPAPGQAPGPEGFKDFFRALRTAFPDLKVTPALLVSDEEHLALAYTMTGTHQGDFHGIHPSGRSITARGLQIARFDSEGRIVERWGSSDELGILTQIGAVQLPA